ncbi:hypothetical protein C7S20_02700 [Christiangramia fulva]|uniref:Uncharacterized protein n=1 Tax=Christiangramia fulva TaxID=2126553 RepID=A0A2R3Z1W4_9FLAO|nr:hypothetical protein [Christiangramia fulva]AVR44257.1 hypothetical protein C7S20_02700 [Christiangramia fulva]
MCLFSSSDAKHFKNGISLEELFQKYDLYMVQKLVKHNLIYIDNINRVFLTDKGKIARQFGFEKFIELELLEKKFLKRNYFLWNLKNSVLYLSLISLIILLGFITIHEL